MREGVHRREEQQREGRRRDEPADDHGRQRTLDLGARGVREGHRQEAERGDEGGHEDGPEAQGRGREDRFACGRALRLQLEAE